MERYRTNPYPERLKARYCTIKYNCRKTDGRSFTLTREQYEAKWNDATTCPILCVPLLKEHKNAIHLDRINNDYGYSNDNTWFISAKANRMKGSFSSPEEMHEFANKWQTAKNPGMG